MALIALHRFWDRRRRSDASTADGGGGRGVHRDRSDCAPTRRAGGRTSRRSPTTAWKGATRAAPAHRRAADYIAAQFQRAGLEPAGTRGYLQPIAFKTRRIVESQSSLALVRSGRDRAADARRRREHQHARRSVARPRRAARVCRLRAARARAQHQRPPGPRSAGSGRRLPVRGAGGLPGPLQAHVGSAAERWKMLKAAGAVGTISIANPKTRGDPVGAVDAGAAAAADVARRSRARRGGGPAAVGDDESGARGQAVCRIRSHVRRGAGAGRRRPAGARLRAAGADQGRRPRRAAAMWSRRTSPASCADPIRCGATKSSSCRRTWIISASPIRRSTATASTTVRWTTRPASPRCSKSRTGSTKPATKPARSILFLAVTGEEKGQLGSRYFAAHPTVPRAALVANVNTDMFLPLFPLKTLMVLGLDESDLGQDIRAVAKELGLGVQADPEPERNRFVRSDQYSFIRGGIPALAMKVGLRGALAGGGDRRQVDRRTVPRRRRRLEPADRSARRRQVRRRRARPCPPHREPHRPPEVERRQLLQAIREGQHRREGLSGRTPALKGLEAQSSLPPEAPFQGGVR